MNGFTEYELRTRNEIRNMVEEGRWTDARMASIAFLDSKGRLTKRASLLRSVKGWVEAMNRREDDE